MSEKTTNGAVFTFSEEGKKAAQEAAANAARDQAAAEAAANSEEGGEEKKKVRKVYEIRINEPEPLPSYQYTHRITSSWLARRISEILRQAFSDVKGVRITWDPTYPNKNGVGSFRCQACFSYTMQETEKPKAAVTVVEKVKKRSKTITDSIIQANSICNGPKTNPGTVQLSSDAMYMLAPFAPDIFVSNGADRRVIQVRDPKNPKNIKWDVLVTAGFTQVNDPATGKGYTVPDLIVDLDANKFLEAILNGTPTSPGYEKRKHLKYDCICYDQIWNPSINQMDDWRILIIATDTKKEMQYARDIGCIASGVNTSNVFWF